EELVRDPEAHFRRVCEHLGIPFEPAAIAYGERGDAPKGLGDPTGVGHHTRPVTTSVARSATDMASKPGVLEQVGPLTDAPDPVDLDPPGYPRERIVGELEAARGAPVPIRRESPTRYRLERKVLVALRRNIHTNRLGRVLKRVRFALDVVLRE